MARKANQLFKSDSDWQNNACLNYSDGWGLYISGYKIAADSLVKKVIRTKRHQDSLVYPIVFLYRHYIELLLKKILLDGYRLLDKTQEVPTVHKLDYLWRECRAILLEIWPEEDTTALDSIETCIKNIMEIDPSSTGFRYPVDKNDKPSLPELTHINIRHLSTTINDTISLLEGASCGIVEYLGYKMECEYEMNRFLPYEEPPY